MNFKEKFNIGNDFIFSPNGVISRKKYFLYAVVLDITFRVICSISGVSGKEISPIFYAFMILLLPIAILKFFNYKKRAFSFLGDNFLAILYSFFYMIIGCFTQVYLHFLQLLNKANLYDLTHNPTFQQYANMNISPFFGSLGGNILFYTSCVLGLVMLVFLLATPTKTFEENNKITNKIPKISTALFNKKNVTIVTTATIILYVISCTFSYNFINKKAFRGLNYVLDKQQIEKVNKLIKLQYDTALEGYKDMVRIYGSWPIEEKPEKPFYFGEKIEINVDNKKREFEHCIISMSNFKDSMYYFSEVAETYNKDYSILKTHWGKMYFNKENHFFTDENNTKFYPRKMLLISIICLLPISIIITIVLFLFVLFVVELFKKINWSKIKDFVKKSSIKKTTLSKKLEELNELKEKGLITEEDYNCKKAELLKDF